MKKMLSVVLGALIVLALSTSFVAASENTSDKQSYGPCWRQSADGGNGKYCGHGRGHGNGQGRGQGCPYYQGGTTKTN